MHLTCVSVSAKYNFTLLKTKNVMVQALDSLPIGVGGGLPRAKSPFKNHEHDTFGMECIGA